MDTLLPQLKGREPDYLDQEVRTLDERIEDLTQRRAEAQQQLENLASYPQLTAEVLARSLGSFDEQLHQLESTRKELQRQALLERNMGIAEDAWEKLPLSDRRTIIEAFFTITLVASPDGEGASERASGEAFSPEDVQLSWKSG